MIVLTDNNNNFYIIIKIYCHEAYASIANILLSDRTLEQHESF